MSAKWTLLLALVALPLRAIDSQQPTGIVTDSAAAKPLAGAVVLGVDAAGITIARALTDGQGRFTLRARPAGGGLRVQRIGFRTRELAFDSTATSQTVALIPVASMLEPIAPRRPTACLKAADPDRLHGLWQQAKTALLASIIAREQNPPAMDIAVYRRVASDHPDSGAMQRVQVGRASSTPITRPRAPGAFVDSGFRERDRYRQFVYHSPDAPVLLSEEFEANHCLELARHPSDRSVVGVRFEPQRRRAARIDVEGHVWIDTARRTLTAIDFEYVGLEPGASKHRPGGAIQFVEMPNGIVFVHRWMLKMVQPILRYGPGLTRGGAPGEWGSSEVPSFHATESGGAVASARWRDGQRWDAPLGLLEVRLVDRAGASVVGAEVSLDSTDYSATSDSAGRARLTRLIPGHYVLSVGDTALSRLGLHYGLRTRFEATEGPSGSTLTVSTREDLVAPRCGIERSEVREMTVLVGRVLRGEESAAGAQFQVDDAKGNSDANGMFVRCWPKGTAPESVEVSVWRDRKGDGSPVWSRRLTLSTFTVVPVVIDR